MNTPLLHHNIFKKTLILMSISFLAYSQLSHAQSLHPRSEQELQRSPKHKSQQSPKLSSQHKPKSNFQPSLKHNSLRSPQTASKSHLKQAQKLNKATSKNIHRVPQQATQPELCFHFDLKPFWDTFSHAKGIDSLSFYPSLFNSPRANASKIYFVDRGVDKDPDAYNNVTCQMNASYIGCKAEDDSANLGIFIEKTRAQLHLKFMILSDLDEELRVLQPLNPQKTPSIPGQVIPCPKESPEASLY